MDGEIKKKFSDDLFYKPVKCNMQFKIYMVTKIFIAAVAMHFNIFSRKLRNMYKKGKFNKE